MYSLLAPSWKRRGCLLCSSALTLPWKSLFLNRLLRQPTANTILISVPQSNWENYIFAFCIQLCPTNFNSECIKLRKNESVDLQARTWCSWILCDTFMQPAARRMSLRHLAPWICFLGHTVTREATALLSAKGKKRAGLCFLHPQRLSQQETNVERSERNPLRRVK